MDRLKRSALIFSLLIVFIPLLFFVYFADSVIELSHSEFLQQNISDDILDQNAETENNASFVVEANTSFVNIDEVVEQNISAEQNEIAPQVFSSDDNSTPPVSNFIDLDEVITQTTTEENNTSFVDIEEIIEQNTSTEQKEDVSVSTSSENTSVESITNTNEFVNLDELVSQDVSKEENQSSLVYENSNDFFIFQKNVKVEKAVYEKILSGKKERVIVVLKDGESYNNLKIEKKKLFNRNKIYVSSNIGEKELQELINSNLIESIYIDREVRASLADSDVIIRSEEARNSFGFSGDGIGICLLDTGVDLNSVNNIEGGYDFVNNDDNALDDNGHGTRMAKVINAIAPDAKIIPVKVLDSSGKGYSSTIMQGISYCLQHANDYSIKIISMSFGGGEFSGYCDYDPVVEAADYAYNNGISIIASAGNDGADYITAPACGKNVTAVSSTTKEDSVASFANINGMVDLLAPGENVNIDGNFYSGTSISAAEVSAAFALLYSYNQTLSPHQAEEMFKTSGSLVNHNDNAYTRIDVYNAILGIYTGYPSNQTVNESEPISYNYSYSIQEYNSDYNAIIAYRSNTGSGLNFPKIRFWNSTGEGSWGPEIQLPTAGSPVRWAVVKWSPISSKIVLVTLSDDGYLDGYVCMGNCTNVANWQVTNNIGQVWTTAAAQRRFDVEFETATGDAVVVYGVLSAVTTRDLAYRVLPASSSSFATTTEQYIDDTGHATDIQYSWVRLARNPRVGQEEIILVGFDLTDNHTNAWVWNGNSWGNQVSITDTATSTSGYQALAVAYAADGSKGMAIGGSGTTGDVNTRYWSGGVWSAIITFDIDPADVADVRWANLKADPASDDLQAVFIDSGSDLTTAYWSGSAWSVTPNIDTAVDVSTARCADFEWDFKGGQGYLVWDTDTTGTTLSYRLCTPQCTNPTQTTSTYAGTGAWITMYQNTKVGDTVRVLGARLNSNFDIGSFSVNSSAPTFRNYGDGAITLDTTVTTYEAYSIAFKIDRTSPSITFVSPTPANNSNIYPWDWAYINVTVVDNVNVSSVILEWNKTTNYTMNKGSGDSWYYNVTGLSTGTYEYKVYAIDFAENLNISEIRYLRLYPGCSGITTAFMCGEIVNESCQMYSNLSFNGTCFRIESSNIKINCNGFAVIGNKSGAGIAAADVQNISIINCIIGNFSSSIILSNVNHSLFRNNTLYKSTHGMLIDPSYNNTIIENTIFGNSQYGLYLDDSHNNTIRYNIFENNTDSGLRLNRSTSNLISNNSFYNNTIAIYLGMGSNSNNITENNISVGSDLVLSYESNNNRIISNRIYNTDRTLVRLEYSNNTIVENNSLSISNMKCLYLYITNQITIRNNTIMNCSEEGIYLSLPNNSVIDNNHIFNTSNGIYTYYAEWSNFTNNEIHNNSVTAVYFDFSKYLIVSNSKMYYNNYGIYSYNTSNLSLFNSNLSNNVYSGVELRYNNNVSVSDNNINSSTNGIFLYYTSSSSISNNSISSSTGILSQYSYNNLVKENNITSSNNGISIVLSNHTNFSNNIVCNNGGIGLRLAYTNQVVSFNDTFCNSGSGIEVYNSNNTNLNNTHLYGNVYFELLISSDSFAVYNLTTTNLTIDNPVGNYENYTILDIEDMYGNLTSEESYGIRWSSQPATLPNDRMSFRNKYVNITQEGGAVNIDKISWRWFDSELNGYNENMFELWKYNTSGWVRLNNTPDTVNNRLSFVNMNPLSTYAILQNNNCPLITSAGLYTQNQNYSGAPNNAAPLSGYACVKITSSNVVFDCNGYSISNNGTGGTTYGILINGSLNNITIKNCEISSYRYGVFVYNSNNTNIFNNTVKNSIDYNIYIYIAQGGLLNNNTLYNSTRGFYLYSVNASEIYNNIIFNHSAIGFYGNSITNNKIYNNSIYSNTISNLMLDSNSQNNYVLDNLIYNSSLSLYIYSSDNNTVLNNSAYNSEYGGYIYTSNYNNLTNNYFYNNVAGLFLTDSQGTYISDNIVYNNYYGFDFEDSGSAFNYINNNTVYNNTIGCLLYSVSGFKFTDNEFYKNTIGIEFSSSIFNDLLNNKFYNNSQYGVDISYTSYLNLTQSEVYNNAVGILVYVSAYVLINNTHSYNNEQLDLLVSADDNIFYNLSISNFTLDNPLGNYENYTILDIEDIYGNLTSEEAYGIRWSSQPATLPNDRMSFRNKYVNITQEGGAVNIDKISWVWVESELSGYNESNFELWKYNSSGWSLLNNTPNTITNRLSLTNLNPLSTYAILQNLEMENCPVIISPGTYIQNKNYTGAPNPVWSYGGYACVYIQAENVTFDCNGYSIINNGTSNSYGIFIDETSSNITIKNCNVSNYTYGLLGYSNVNIAAFNNTLHSNEVSGFAADATSNITVINNTIYNNTYYGVYIISGATANFENTLLYNNLEDGVFVDNFNNVFVNNVTSKDTYGDCFLFTNSENISIHNISASNCSDAGAYGGGVKNVTISNSSIMLSSYGVYLFSSQKINTSGNQIYNLSTNSFYAINSKEIFILDNSIVDASNGIYWQNVTNGSIKNNYAFNSSSFSNIYYATFINLNNNTLKNISNNIIFLYSNLSNITLNNIYCRNTAGTYGLSVSNGFGFNVVDNFIIGCTSYGISFSGVENSQIRSNNISGGSSLVYLQSSNNNLSVVNNILQNSINNGLITVSLTNSTIENNTIYNVSYYALYLTSSSNYNLISSNKIYSNRRGIYNIYVDFCNFTNNEIYNSSEYLVYSSSSNNNRFINNSMYNSTSYGVHLYNSQFFNFTHNTIYGTSNRAFTLQSSSNNTLSNNDIKRISQVAVYLYANSSDNLFIDNTIHDNTNYAFYVYQNSVNNTFYNNTLFNNSYGFFILNSNFQNIDHCNIYNNTQIGVQFSNSNYSIISNSMIYNNTNHGVSIGSSSNIIITNTTIHNHNYHGIVLSSSDYNNITNNTVYNNNWHGIYVQFSNNTVIVNNTIYKNSQNGIYLTSSHNAIISDNNVTNNSVYGIFFSSSNLNTMSDNYVCFNTLDINNSGSSNIGAYDRCDKWYNWFENSHPGCTFTCSKIWHRFFGNVSGNILLAPNETSIFYNWTWNTNKGKVYVINGDAVIDWAAVFALGRNISEQNSTNDFAELNNLLNMGDEYDNLTNLYSYDGSNPLITKNISVYGKMINFIPLANSSYQTAGVHYTGIMWDSSQGGPEFSQAQNQDVIFVNEINGSYDPQYDIRVPAELGTYKGTSGVVEFWLELD